MPGEGSQSSGAHLLELLRGDFGFALRIVDCHPVGSRRHGRRHDPNGGPGNGPTGRKRDDFARRSSEHCERFSILVLT